MSEKIAATFRAGVRAIIEGVPPQDMSRPLTPGQLKFILARMAAEAERTAA